MVTIQSQNFGVEIEMTGVSRGTAASVIANYFGVGGIHFAGGTYQTYEAKDSKGRVWKCMRDGSITPRQRGWPPGENHHPEPAQHRAVGNLRPAGLHPDQQAGFHVPRGNLPFGRLGTRKHELRRWQKCQWEIKSRPFARFGGLHKKNSENGWALMLRQSGSMNPGG